MRKKQQSGFTLIELIMTIILMGIISVITGKVLLQHYQIFLASQNISNADWNGWLGLERMTNDIHMIRSPSDISTASASQLTFVDMNGSSVQYQITGGNLLRNSEVLASGISSGTFSYLSKTGATTATTTAIRYVSISLTATQGNLSMNFATLAGTRGMS